MQIQEFFDKDTSTLTYVISEGGIAVVIDPALHFDFASGKTSLSSVEPVLNYLRNHKLDLRWILETHAHADHLTGAPVLKKAFPRARVGISENIRKVQNLFGKVFNLNIKSDGSQFDYLFKDGDVIDMGQPLSFTVHFTPGHTPACASFKFANHLFTGDSIFMPDSGTGRCDFPGASAEELYTSIHDRIYKMPPTTKIYVGHDYQPGGRPLQFCTTVADEMASNIHLKAETTRETFVEFRSTRDKTLSAPKLLLPSIQININGGKLPEPESNGTRYLKIPIYE